MGERPAWPDQPGQFLPPPAVPEPELPLPDLMQLGSSTLTDWLFMLLAVAVMVRGFAMLRVRRVRRGRLEAASRAADHSRHSGLI